MELNTAKYEETKDGLNETLGITDHAGGEGTADSSTQELGIGQDTSTEETKLPGEPWLSNAHTLAYVCRVTKHHGQGEEDGRVLKPFTWSISTVDRWFTSELFWTSDVRNDQK